MLHAEQVLSELRVTRPPWKKLWQFLAQGAEAVIIVGRMLHAGLLGYVARPSPPRGTAAASRALTRAVLASEVSPMRADAYEQELGIFLETLARTAHCGTAASGAQVYYAAHRRLAVL